MNTFEHIFPEFRHVMALSDAERIRFMETPRWIGYPKAQSVLQTLEKLFNSSSEEKRKRNLLLIGDPANGKTTLIKRFYEKHGQGYVEENSTPIKPVILAESPPKASEKELYYHILERFFAPYRFGDPTAKLRRQVVHLFHACKVRMLIIDEFHSLLEGTARQQREVMNCVKFLCNELKVPIVAVGTRNVIHALHTDPQHASRFDTATLPLWEAGKEFQSLLKGFETVLPLKKPSGLSAPESASLLHTISGGNIGDLHTVLVECAEEAILTGEERITLEIIKGKRKWQRLSNGIRELPL